MSSYCEYICISDATISDIRKSLEDANEKAEKYDFIFVYFSAHGGKDKTYGFDYLVDANKHKIPVSTVTDILENEMPKFNGKPKVRTLPGRFVCNNYSGLDESCYR